MIVPIPVMYGGIGEAMFRYGEMKAKESNREWLKSLEKKFVEAFDKNDFNIAPICLKTNSWKTHTRLKTIV